MIIYLPLLVCLIGLILYFAVRNNGELKEVGRICFAFGLLVFLLEVTGHTVSLFK